MSAVTVTGKAVNLSQLAAEMQATLGFPPTLGMKGNQGEGEPKTVTAADPVTQSQLDDAIVTHVADFSEVGPRRPRKLYDILTDLNALTTTQKGNVNADLFGGSPPKWSQDRGPNAAALIVYYTLTQTVTLTPADKNLIRLHATALVVQDQPNYLVRPPFDQTIVIYGDEAIP